MKIIIAKSIKKNKKSKRKLKNYWSAIQPKQYASEMVKDKIKKGK